MNHYRQAVEATIARADRSLTPPDAPLIELTRALAVHMDEVNGQPSTRLSQAYLSALRALARRADPVREPRRTSKPARSARCPDGLSSASQP